MVASPAVGHFFSRWENHVPWATRPAVRDQTWGGIAQMALDYEKLMALKRTGDHFSYTDRETMLYAIGIGMSRDPYDEKELAYTFEKTRLKTVASMATVLQRIPLLRDC